MPIPYIYVSPRTTVRQACGFDNENGVIYRDVEAEHAIWAARVPFLPAMLSDDFMRVGRQRIEDIQARMYRFIHDLSRARENSATFELRYISTPNPVPDQPNLIDILFLGKVVSIREGGSKPLARRLWDKFFSNFPLEDPFNYPLEAVADEAEFWRYYEPFPLNPIKASQIYEVRKYEDMPIRSSAPLGRVERKGDYIAHPIVPTVGFNPMSRFMAALAVQPQKCYVSISIRPTRMYDQEVFNVSYMIGKFENMASQDKREEKAVTEEYIRTRSLVGASVYNSLIWEREELMTVRLHVVGETEAPYGLMEALGSELMGYIKDHYPTQCTAVQPADDQELAAAVNNLRYLEHDLWGYTIASAPLQRFRYLCTAYETFGAFRLPVPPESGYVPGVLVKNEPFYAQAEELEIQRLARANMNDAFEETHQSAQEPKVNLGMVYHRGNHTYQPFKVNIRDLTRHSLIAGSTGSGKSTTIKHILAQLWTDHHIPFLVLYPINKPDYRDLIGFTEIAKNLLIFTLGDERTSPFRFNPFEVPDGLLLKTHLSRLMRVFTTAFSLQDPLPMIYREALRMVYRQHGWDPVSDLGESGRAYPIMSEFHEAIRQVTDGLEYGREVKDTVRQASVIRIADLMENAGHVVNVRQSMPLREILEHPTIMEIGRVGSLQDTSLLMGFLMMRFAEEVERHPRAADSPHITVIEEAHRLMAESSDISPFTGNSQSAAGEDFSNILAEVRGFGEGIIIAEQIPTTLVKGAIGNTYIKIMHWLEDAPSYSLFSNIMNLNQQQREYARTLTPGFAIVRSPFGRPVHIKVPEFGDAQGFDSKAAQKTGDAEIHDLMTLHRQKFGIEDVPVEPWQVSLAALDSGKDWKTSTSSLQWMLTLPMQTCAFCRPLHKTGSCLYVRKVAERALGSYDCQTLYRKLIDCSDPAQASKLLQELAGIFSHLYKGLPETDLKGLLYCFLAHQAGEALHDPSASAEQRRNARSALVKFTWE